MPKARSNESVTKLYLRATDALHCRIEEVGELAELMKVLLPASSYRQIRFLADFAKISRAKRVLSKQNLNAWDKACEKLMRETESLSEAEAYVTVSESTFKKFMKVK